MNQTKFRKFRLGVLFFIVGLFFVLLTGCTETGQVNKEDVRLAYEQVQITFEDGDTKISVTKDFQLTRTIEGVPIQWISSNEDAIAIVQGQAVVTRSNEDVVVYLTAKIGNRGFYQYKTFEVIVKGDTQIPPEEVRHRVRFFVDDVLYGEVQMVLDGDNALLPMKPFKEDHRFMGWFLDPNFAHEFDVSLPITKDIDVYGKFEQGGYQVRFFVDGVLYGSPQYVKFGDSAVLPEDPVVDGKYFMGWDRQSLIIIDNTDIHAILTPIPSYVVKFVDHDDSLLTQQQVYEKTAASAPANPTRVGYTFTGWDKPFNYITSNLTVKAQYQINQYTVTFKVPGLDDVVQTLDYGSEIVAPQVADKVGHSFAWVDQIPQTVPAQNIVINGAYTPNNYTITYKVAGLEDDVVTVQFGEDIQI